MCVEGKGCVGEETGAIGVCYRESTIAEQRAGRKRKGQSVNIVAQKKNGRVSARWFRVEAQVQREGKFRTRLSSK
jgi:hypothetical protein